MPDLIQTPADPAAPAAIPPPAVPSGGVDTSSPAFVEAVNAAVGVALANHDDRLVAAVKGDKTKLQEKLAAETEARKAAEEKVAEFELAESAAKADTTPDKLRAEVDERVRRREELLDQQRALVDDETAKRITELEETANAAVEKEAETWYMAKIGVATSGAGWRDRAAELLYRDLKPYMVRVETPAGDDIRFRVNDQDVPGSGPKGLMTLDQLLGLPPETQGKTIPRLDSSYYQHDHGNGSNTRKPETESPETDWRKLSAKQRHEYSTKHGPAAAKKLIDASPRASAAA